MPQVIPVEPINPFANPTIVNANGAMNLSTSAAYLVRVTPSGGSLAITVAAGHSHRLQNEGSQSFTVTGVSTGVKTVQPGNEIELAWSQTQNLHEVQETKSNPVLDTTTSTSSTNAVQNAVITNYVNSSVAAAVGSVVLDNLAAIRALTSTPVLVTVKGHTTVGDGGGGLFRLVQPAGTVASGNRGDIGTAVLTDLSTTTPPANSGHDDDGWTIITNTAPVAGAVYMRMSDTCIPQHFGAFPVATEAAAKTMADRYARLQRWLMFWSYRAQFFSCATYYPNEPGPTNFVMPEGWYRSDSTLLVYMKDTFPASAGYAPVPMTMVGRVFTPKSVKIPCFKVYAGENAYKPPTLLNCVREKEATGKVTWNTDPWPDLWRDSTAYRPWAASTTWYKAEYCTVVLGDGSTRMYECTVAGVTHASTAPSHTNGTAVANGTATFRDMGSIRNSSGLSSRDLLQRCTDIGVYLVHCKHWMDLGWKVEGYTVCAMLFPRDYPSSVSFNRLRTHVSLGCKIGFALCDFIYDFLVADQPARLALTGLAKGSIVRQSNDAVNDYRLNVQGGESNAANWSTVTPWSGAYAFVNENIFENSMNYARGASQFADTDKSEYGVAICSFTPTLGQGSPSNNIFDGVNVEKADKTGRAEVVHVVAEKCQANRFNCRTDSPTLYRTFVMLERPARQDEARRNVFTAARAGRFDSIIGERLDRNNGQLNRLLEPPDEWHDNVHEYSVPSLFADCVFSGKDKIFFRNLGLVPPNAPGSPTDNAVIATSGLNGWIFNAADRSFDIPTTQSSVAGPAMFIDIPDNTTMGAVVQVIAHLSPAVDVSGDTGGVGIRSQVLVCDPITGAVGNGIDSEPAGTPPRPRRYIQIHEQTPQLGTYGGTVKWYRDSAGVEVEWLAFERWVKRIILHLSGNDLLGFTVRLYNAPGGGIRPVHQVSRGYAVVESAPERGIYRAPMELLLADQTGANKMLRLNKTRASGEHWAVSQTGGLPGSPTTWQWASDSAGVVKEWDGTTWNTIATGVNLIVPADWTAVTS